METHPYSADEDAREEKSHVVAPRLQKRGFGSLQNVTAEAEKRIEMAKDLKLVSAEFSARLSPYVDALESFKRRGEQVIYQPCTTDIDIHV